LQQAKDMQIDPDFDNKVTRVSGREATALVDAGVMVLDVRSPGEFTGLGHIPGAKLLPVDLSASAPAMIADVETPVLVTCEHAVRSKFTTRLLAQAGFTKVYELAYGMAGWTGDREFDEAPLFGPSPWVLENADLLPRGGRVLDVACGAGRHALLLAGAGFNVTAIDRDTAVIDRLRHHADRLGLPLQTEVIDLERDDESSGVGAGAGVADVARETAAPPPAVLAPDTYDLVLVTRYLHRPLFPKLIRSLAPGGILIYETFLEQQAERGHPKNPAFLLKPGELSTLVAPLTILRSAKATTTTPSSPPSSPAAPSEPMPRLGRILANGSVRAWQTVAYDADKW
jgi:rhodanese-related sulfurtransferase